MTFAYIVLCVIAVGMPLELLWLSRTYHKLFKVQHGTVEIIRKSVDVLADHVTNIQEHVNLIHKVATETQREAMRTRAAVSTWVDTWGSPLVPDDLTVPAQVPRGPRICSTPDRHPDSGCIWRDGACIAGMDDRST